MDEWLTRFASFSTLHSSYQGVGLLDAVRGVLAAFVFGQVLALSYERTFTGVSYARSFSHTLVLTSLASATFVMAIGRSIYAGLGLLGVLSMIRFRSNLKAPRDLVFVLGAATAGVASGVDALPVALVGTLAFALVAVYLHHSALGSRQEYDGVLRFTCPAHTPAGPDGPDGVGETDGVADVSVQEVLGAHCRKAKVLSVAEVGQGGWVEHTYQIQLNDNAHDALLDAIRTSFNASDVRILLQDASLEY